MNYKERARSLILMSRGVSDSYLGFSKPVACFQCYALARDLLHKPMAFTYPYSFTACVVNGKVTNEPVDSFGSFGTAFVVIGQIWMTLLARIAAITQRGRWKGNSEDVGI